jgi:hypothetical protein
MALEANVRTRVGKEGRSSFSLPVDIPPLLQIRRKSDATTRVVRPISRTRLHHVRHEDIREGLETPYAQKERDEGIDKLINRLHTNEHPNTGM